MSLRQASWLVFIVCLTLTPTVGAQKGSKPKPVDQIATATFRCNGVTAQTHNPPGTPCGPYGAFGAPDGITGDGQPYVGVGTTVGGVGAFMRFDGELEIILRPTQTRLLFFNFEKVVSPPTAGARKTFDFADLAGVDINTNIINPVTGDAAVNGALAMSVGMTWPTRIKGNWTDPYGQGYVLRFNPDDYPGSNYAWVTRNSDKEWTLFATDREVARLVTLGTKRVGWIDEGWYIMPFEITFTLP